jgi:dethiobiotin synthetase
MFIMQKKISLFITGTDTEVGKTYIACGVAEGFVKMGYSVGVMKPVATGLRKYSTDALKLIKASRVNDNYEIINPVRYGPAVSPNIAGEISGRQVNIPKIMRAFKILSRKYEIMVVEGIGGLMVPLKNDFFVADLVKKMNAYLVVVSRPTIGTLNHTIMTIMLAKACGLSIAGFVINYHKNFRIGISEKKNPRVIEDITGVPLLGIVRFRQRDFRQICLNLKTMFDL